MDQSKTDIQFCRNLNNMLPADTCPILSCQWSSYNQQNFQANMTCHKNNQPICYIDSPKMLQQTTSLALQQKLWDHHCLPVYLDGVPGPEVAIASVLEGVTGLAVQAALTAEANLQLL